MKNYIYLLFTAIFFGSIGVFVKMTGDSVHPMVLNFYRIFFGFLTLLVICPMADKTAFKVKKTDFKMYILIGLLIAVALSLTNIAYLYAPVQNVSILSGVSPFFVFFFAYLLLKEKVTLVKIVTLLIAFVGLAVINPLSAEGVIGNVLALVGALFYGLLVTLMRKQDKTNSIGDVMWFFFFAMLFLLPFPLIYSFGEISVSLVLLGVLSTGFAYFFYNLALEKLEAEISSIFLMIVTTMVAVSLALVVLGEELNMQIIVGGGLLIIAGVYLETHSKQLKQAELLAAEEMNEDKEI